MERIYLDSAATAPLDAGVLARMMPYLTNKFGNSASSHWFGREARAGLEEARESVARVFFCDPLEVIFNSGATEGNNTIIKTIADNHIITTTIEHSSVLKPCQELENRGQAEVTYVKPDKNGQITANAIKKVIKDNTVLISVVYAQSETGVIQPICEIGKMIEKVNIGRERKIFFHSDITQIAGFAGEQFNLRKPHLRADFLTFSAHKFGGPKGVGALIATKKYIPRLLLGGEQEFGFRAGTVNVAGAVGLGLALVKRFNSQPAEKTEKIRQYLESKLIDIGLKINFADLPRAPHITSVFAPNILGQEMVMALDLAGVAVSFGSACSAGASQASQSLISMGLSKSKAERCIRISILPETTTEEIDNAVIIIKDIIKEKK